MAPLVGSVPRFSLTILARSVARRSFVLHNEQFQSAWAVSTRRVQARAPHFAALILRERICHPRAAGPVSWR